MPTTRSPRLRPMHAFSSLLVLAAPLLALPSASEAAPGTDTEVGRAPSAPRVEHANYVVYAKAAEGAVEANKPASFDVVLEVKGAYKINDKFPARFKLADPPQGVSYPKPVVPKEDGEWDGQKGRLSVPFVAERAGKHRLAGTLSMSVCSEDRCLLERVNLDVEVEAR